MLYQYIAENSYSISDSIRKIPIEHCYGKIAVREMRKKNLDKNYKRGIKFSVSETKVNLEMLILGKKNTPSKFACHKNLKDDLEKLATLNNCTLSEYIRDVLYKHYFSNSFVTNLDLIEEDELIE